MYRTLLAVGATLVEKHRETLTRRLPRAVAGALSLLLVVQIAWLAIALIPPDRGVATPPLSGALTERIGARGRTFETLPSAHLFGEAPSGRSAGAVRPAAALVAPATSLNLTLTGIVLGYNGMGSQAIIADGDAERSYRPGEALESGLARLHEVHADRVILERDGQLETLWPNKLLAAASAEAVPLAQIAPAPIDADGLVPTGAPLAADVPATNVALPRVPGASPVTNVIRLTAYKEGSVSGLRANPGRDAQTFRSLGLEAGDVITNVNGTPLGGTPNGTALLRELQNSPSVSVSVVRDGISQVVAIPAGALSDIWAQR